MEKIKLNVTLLLDERVWNAANQSFKKLSLCFLLKINLLIYILYYFNTVILKIIF